MACYLQLVVLYLAQHIVKFIDNKLFREYHWCLTTEFGFLFGNLNDSILRTCIIFGESAKNAIMLVHALHNLLSLSLNIDASLTLAENYHALCAPFPLFSFWIGVFSYFLAILKDLLVSMSERGRLQKPLVGERRHFRLER